MLEAAFAFGLVIFIGLAFLFVKMPRWLTFWCLRHHLLLDLVVFGVALWIHWGTMTGLMSATIAGLCCSMATSFGRWWWRLA
jgi:hypothetical protein